MRKHFFTAGILPGRNPSKFILLVCILLVSTLFFGCKKEVPVIDPAQIQKEFVQNLFSGYPAPDFTKTLSEAFTKPGEYTITRLAKGGVVSYKKDTSVYKGALESDTYCLRKNNGLYLLDGTMLLSAPAGNDRSFRVRLFPQNEEWNILMLRQINEFYPLTILEKDTHGVIDTFEELVDIWDPDYELLFVLGDPIPAYIVETSTNVYLFGKELEAWHSHKQVAGTDK